MQPRLDIDGPLARITLRRPQAANKLLPEDLPALIAHVQRVNATPEVLVLVLQAEGRHFCSGYEIAQVVHSQNEGSAFGEMVDAFEACRAVTVAALHGGVYGGATDLALACDFRVGDAQHTAMFMPAARLGLHFYASGLERYVTRLGVDMAKRLFLTAEPLDAPAMHGCGFLTHLAPAGGVPAAVDALAATLTGMAPLALLGMKKHLNRIARGQGSALDIAQAVQATVASQDLREGALAWSEKRAPRFVGR